MALDLVNFIGDYGLSIGDDEIAVRSANITGGASRITLITRSGSGLTVQDIITKIIGSTTAAGDLATNLLYGLRRLTPFPDPCLPYRYASNILAIRGKGTGNATRANPVQPASNKMAWGLANTQWNVVYDQYEIDVELTARTYPVLPDSQIPLVTTTWRNFLGQITPIKYPMEWLRYCDFELTTQNDLLQGTQGSMDLHTAFNVSEPFPNPPWQWLPNQLLKITWYQVPYNYVISSDSYITGVNPKNQFKGCINQEPWWFWPRGSLLYLGYNVTRYTPPVNLVDLFNGYTGAPGQGTSNILTSSNYSKLCDVELIFQLTSRQNASPEVPAFVGNFNNVPYGHNLLPSIPKNGFYYATRRVGAGADITTAPLWKSFPVGLLFANPDIPNNPYP